MECVSLFGERELFVKLKILNIEKCSLYPYALPAGPAEKSSVLVSVFG